MFFSYLKSQIGYCKISQLGKDIYLNFAAKMKTFAENISHNT